VNYRGHSLSIATGIEVFSMNTRYLKQDGKLCDNEPDLMV
jgi:hypothetical protein